MLFHLYGFFIGLGIIIGAWVSETVRKKLPTTYHLLPTTYNLLPYILIPGLIGARAYHVIDYWQDYSENPLEILFIWQGGLAIFGGLFGGIGGLWIFLKLKVKSSKLKVAVKSLKFKNLFLSLLDIGAFGLPVGQAIGRVGNYFNQELYGLPTNLPWGIYIRPENRLPGFETFERFHPLFAYESLWCLVVFMMLLMLLRSLKLFDRLLVPRRGLPARALAEAGIFFFSYLFLYSFGRFFLEFLRIRRVNQLIALFLIIFSAMSIMIFKSKFCQQTKDNFPCPLDDNQFF